MATEFMNPMNLVKPLPMNSKRKTRAKAMPE